MIIIAGIVDQYVEVSKIKKDTNVVVVAHILGNCIVTCTTKKEDTIVVVIAGVVDNYIGAKPIEAYTIVVVIAGVVGYCDGVGRFEVDTITIVAAGIVGNYMRERPIEIDTSPGVTIAGVVGQGVYQQCACDEDAIVVVTAGVISHSVVFGRFEVDTITVVAAGIV